MKKVVFILAISLPIFSCYNAYGAVLGEELSNTIKTQAHINYKLDSIQDEVPKSIILIIADGTGIGQYTLSYYSNGEFSPARFDHIGLVATHPKDGECSASCKRVTDSGASGTALSTGEKTYNGAIAVNQNLEPIKTIIEWAEEKGMSTGLVATSTVTHATPASFASHIDYRGKESEIAVQLSQSDVDVILGGGKSFWPDSLIQRFTDNNGQFINNIQTDIDPTKRLLGLFSDKGLLPVNDGRNTTTTQMAEMAISYLENNKNGYFVMIEESQVDWGGHANSAEYIKGEMASLNELVDFVLDYQSTHPEVLVVLTADHECGGVAVHDASDDELDIHFTSGYHSANFVPIWATGPGAEVFDAFMDNTEIGKKLIEYVKSR